MVIGGIGSVSGSIIATFLYVACSEWWLRFLDSELVFTSPTDPGRLAFIVVFAVAVIAIAFLGHPGPSAEKEGPYPDPGAAGVGLWPSCCWAGWCTS